MGTPNSDRLFYRFAAKVLAEITGLLAIPALSAVLLGNYLDQRFSSKPLYISICLIIAAIISATTIRQKTKELGAEFQKLVDQNPSQPKPPQL